MKKFVAKMKYAFIFLGLGFVFCFYWFFGLVVPALRGQIPMPEILVYALVISWCILLFLGMVGMDRIAYYLLLPKNERGDFWHIKTARFIKTFDFSELDKK